MNFISTGVNGLKNIHSIDLEAKLQERREELEKLQEKLKMYSEMANAHGQDVKLAD